ncbi:hypothetical protein HDU93_009697 [Gonapodya sp. JEL0774]|nr:hypothetical protein HDU93_009697 [Gonapodya sp. JEL0774]
MKTFPVTRPEHAGVRFLGAEDATPQHMSLAREDNFVHFKSGRIARAQVGSKDFRDRRSWAIAKRNLRVRESRRTFNSTETGNAGHLSYHDWPDDVANLIRNRCILRARKLLGTVRDAGIGRNVRDHLADPELDLSEPKVGSWPWGVSLLSELPFLPRTHSLVINFAVLRTAWTAHAPTATAPASTRFFLSTMCSDGLLDLWVLRRVSAEAPDAVVASYSHSHDILIGDLGTVEQDGALRKGKLPSRRVNGEEQALRSTEEPEFVLNTNRDTREDTSCDDSILTDDGSSAFGDNVAGSPSRERVRQNSQSTPPFAGSTAAPMRNALDASEFNGDGKRRRIEEHVCDYQISFERM